MTQELTVIGLMSGTSLDGLDICCAEFSKQENQYSYRILAAETIPYSDQLRQQLSQAPTISRDDLELLSFEFGQYMGQEAKHFIEKFKLTSQVDLVASHGQTIFHEPDKGITVQIGDGAILHEEIGINVINNFRIKDVELGGQGAPLVPIGDKLLFYQYESCLNLGGFANVSFDKDGERIAFDICPANLPLNKISTENFGLPYDANGDLARVGEVDPDLLRNLNSLDYYHLKSPKSLGYEWLDREFYPELQLFPNQDRKNILATCIAHETDQIATVLNENKLRNCLVSGGGVLNNFFMEMLRKKTSCDLVVPDTGLIEFKEALIFAFLAYLNINDEINTLSSVTGAKSDSIAGIRHFTT
jgi:anhydro-N-acetylmuramic acid kinase